MAREPKKFIVPISDVRITDTVAVSLGIERLIEILVEVNPQLAGLSAEHIKIFNTEDYTEHGSGGWDKYNKHKSLCILHEDDRPPANWLSDATDEHLRPVITLHIDANGNVSGMLKYRRLVYKGMKGHDHFPVYGKMEFEDVEFVRGTPDLIYASDAEVKAQYAIFPDITPEMLTFEYK